MQRAKIDRSVRRALPVYDNDFQADTTRPLVKHFRKVLKNPTSGLGADAITILLQF